MYLKSKIAYLFQSIFLNILINCGEILIVILFREYVAEFEASKRNYNRQIFIGVIFIGVYFFQMFLKKKNEFLCVNIILNRTTYPRNHMFS